jgi:hypothetical protein
MHSRMDNIKIIASQAKSIDRCGNTLLTFPDNLSMPLSRVKKCKGENRTWLKLTDTIFLIWNFAHRLIFYFFK